MDIPSFCAMLPKTFQAWSTLCAYPRNAERYCEVLDVVPAMTTPSNMHLLNCAVQCMEPGEVYLEVGTWRGSTFIGALIGNDNAHGYAIDNDTMTEHNHDERRSKDVWHENVETFHLSNRATYIDAAVPDVWSTPNLTNGSPVGVYLFDGAKSSAEEALAGIEGVIPFLADHALIVVDDSNQATIREAVWYLQRKYPNNACLLYDIPTPGNTWPGFWDGLMIIGWVRQQ